MKEGKVTGPDNMQSEFLKLLDENTMKWLTVTFKHMYKCGNIPKQ